MSSQWYSSAFMWAILRVKVANAPGVVVTVWKYPLATRRISTIEKEEKTKYCTNGKGCSLQKGCRGPPPLYPILGARQPDRKPTLLTLLVTELTIQSPLFHSLFHAFKIYFLFHHYHLLFFFFFFFTLRSRKLCRFLMSVFTGIEMNIILSLPL